MYRLQTFNFDEEERDVYETIFGRYNDYPPGWKEIEVASEPIPTAYSLTHMEHRQMFIPFGVPNNERGRYGYGNFTCADLQFLKDGTGYAYVIPQPKFNIETKKYDALRLARFKFDAKEQLKKYVGNLPFLEGNDWDMTANSKPDYGYRSYRKTMVFERKLTTVEYKYLHMWLLRDNCPGWTGISSRVLAEPGRVSYIFSTVYDSSD